MMISRCVIGFVLLATAFLGSVPFATADGPTQRRFPKFEPTRVDSDSAKSEKKLAKATFGGGCFWCVEAVFENLKGVESVVSGYSGGKVLFPTYKQVLTGLTGHAEVTQINYDPSVISFPELLEVFWSTHDPTTLNRQGPDFGTQYRSVVFYHDDEQKKLAEHYKKKLDESGAFRKPIVTEISEAKRFYSAEKYHQDFYENNKRNPYCARYIRPKMKKLNLVFAEKLK